MSELGWLAVSMLAAGTVPGLTPAETEPPPGPAPQTPKSLCLLCFESWQNGESEAERKALIATTQARAIAASVTPAAPEFSGRLLPISPKFPQSTPPPLEVNWSDPSLPALPRPTTGGQLYRQRLAALRMGATYTRLPASSFWETWSSTTEQPTYQQWVSLLRAEAQAMARGQGSNRLSIMLGDSISQWFPPEQLAAVGETAPGETRFWLNQGISGDTTTGVLRRLSTLAHTRPDTIHLMVGINDLRRGVSESTLLNNLYTIVWQLRQMHPQSQIIVYSLLPTRLPAIPPARIQRLNRVIEAIARHTGSRYFDLHAYFSDDHGVLRRELTTDGLHLSRRGYALWQWAVNRDASYGVDNAGHLYQSHLRDAPSL